MLTDPTDEDEGVSLADDAEDLNVSDGEDGPVRSGWLIVIVAPRWGQGRLLEVGAQPLRVDATGARRRPALMSPISCHVVRGRGTRRAVAAAACPSALSASPSGLPVV